jgi:hypothetical protein
MYGHNAYLLISTADSFTVDRIYRENQKEARKFLFPPEPLPVLLPVAIVIDHWHLLSR